MAGVLIADYWLIRRTTLKLTDLYRPEGVYRYTGGLNPRAVISIVAGALLSVGGAYSAPPGSGPFPVAGMIGWFKPLYDYSWVVGLVAAFLLYYLLMTVFPARREEPRPATAPAT